MTAPLATRAIAEVLATSTGGVGTHVRGILPALVRSGAELRVHGPQSTQDLFTFTTGGARFAPVEIASGPKPRQDLRAAASLRRLTADADLIHAHGLRAATVAALANIGRRTPLVVTLHNAVSTDSAPLRMAYAAIERFVGRSADVVLGASADLVDRSREVGARDVRFAPVGAPPLVAPLRSRSEVRAELKVADEIPMLLCVGRLHQQKGYDVLVPASVRWSSRSIKPVVLIAGDGPLRGELQNSIDALGAPIRLLGRRSDIAELMQAADLVLLPSRWEARSLVAQEAMRAGRPLVTTTPGGMAELVGDAARVVPTGDVQALTEAVDELLDDPAELDRLSAAGLVRSAQWPTEQDSADELTALYAELLARPGRREVTAR